MSDTPLTDAVGKTVGTTEELPHMLFLRHARQMERERSEALNALEMLLLSSTWGLAGQTVAAQAPNMWSVHRAEEVVAKLRRSRTGIE